MWPICLTVSASFCQKVLEPDSGIVILASDLPAFLYAGNYNPEAIDDGLLRGMLPVMVSMSMICCEFTDIPCSDV